MSDESTDRPTRIDRVWQQITAAAIRAGGIEHLNDSHANYLAKQLNREAAVERALENASCVDPQWSADRDAIQQYLESNSTDRARRREVELELADYIDGVGRRHPSACRYYRLDELAERMRQCRQGGTVGAKPQGGYVVVWDSKCDQVRLCPDEAREETQRVASRYVPPMMAWQREKPGVRRLYWCVLTLPNYPAGQLAEGKREAFQRFVGHIWRGKYQACPVEFRRRRPWERADGGPAYETIRPDRRRTITKFNGALKGALCVQEDPLAAGGTILGADWNIHLNVILMCEGQFDFAELRQEWGANLEIRQLSGDEESLRGAVLECVKYAAQAVPSKSAEKAADGETAAPAMTEWPAARWIEWWGAQQRFRRTRSYGVLHGVPAPPTMALEDVEWIGTIEYVGGYYRARVVPPTQIAGVGSIPGDNFSASPPASGADPPERGRYRPPGHH